MSLQTRAPSLLAKTLGVTFVVLIALLGVIFTIVTVSVRHQVRQNVQSTLESGQRVLAELEAQHQRDVLAQATILAENPTLRAALDTYVAERSLDGPSPSPLLDTVTHELHKLAALVELDALVLVDPQQVTLTAAGPRGTDWPAGSRVTFAAPSDVGGRTEVVIHRDSRVYRAIWVDLRVDGDTIGRLYIVSLLDERFVANLARVSNARIAVASSGHVIASTLPSDVAKAFGEAAVRRETAEGAVVLAGELFSFRRLVEVGDVSVYALGSIDELASVAMRQAMRTILFIGVGTTAFALLGSIWIAHLLTGPVGRLSGALRTLSASRDTHTEVPRTGSSRELDMLVDTFNQLMASRAAAEAETEAAYTGAIRALAAALDARDPYTAGHSERVSVVSVAIGRTLTLSDGEIEVLRLGALLHDIGKIGVPDGVLLKSGPLTAEEYALIQRHPELGARILQSVPFLAPHLPIVELHHERPDGKGYPYGLRGDTTPLLARIVHVADAYDAMTSARAYRQARSSSDAMRELWRCAGHEFDTAIVEALAVSLSVVTAPASDLSLRVVHA